jgi:hypothetical protein
MNTACRNFVHRGLSDLYCAAASTGWAVAVLSLATLLAPGAKGAETLPGTGGSNGNVTLFSFDDVSVPFTHNLRLTMHRPEKLAENPVVQRGGKGTPDEFGVQFYGSVVRDGDRYRMWYVAVDDGLEKDARSAQIWRPAYAESRDGIHWTKPELGLVEYRGNRRNNLLPIERAPLGMINLKVLVEPDDPDPSRRYKMTAQAWWREGDSRGRGTLVVLFSADGLRWRAAVRNPPVDGLIAKEDLLLPEHHFEAAGGLYRWNGIYYATGQSAPPGVRGTREYSGREILLHRSPDFIHWSRTASVGFLRGSQYKSFPFGEGEECHEGVSVWNRGNVLLGLFGQWHGGKQWQDRTIDLGFLVSNDGLNFREPVPESVFLPRGNDGAWDQGGLLQGQGFENVGDRTFIWYGAWDPRVGTVYTPRGGVGLATLPRDRFGSLSPREAALPAELITAPVEMRAGTKLLANVDGLSEQAVLRVELLDRHERPLPQFAGANAAVVRRSGLATAVTWAGATPLGEIREPARIRVIFEGDHRQQVALYALYLQN